MIHCDYSFAHSTYDSPLCVSRPPLNYKLFFCVSHSCPFELIGWEGEEGRVALRQAPGLPAIGRPRRHRGPRAKPFTPDPFGPSELSMLTNCNDQCPTVNAWRGRTDRDASRA